MLPPRRALLSKENSLIWLSSRGNGWLAARPCGLKSGVRTQHISDDLHHNRCRRHPVQEPAASEHFAREAASQDRHGIAGPEGARLASTAMTPHPLPPPPLPPPQHPPRQPPSLLRKPRRQHPLPQPPPSRHQLSHHPLTPPPHAHSRSPHSLHPPPLPPRASPAP